ncbi:cyclase family protein, partial [Staphylococcus epidermidis]|uniref:cyclase family protein n=1 Tax=Staphylococcus epidermidis TaxID=1282 RepID=UPI0037D9E90E
MLTQYPTHIHPPIHFLQNTTYLQQLHLKELLLPLILLHYSKQPPQNSHFILSPKHLQHSQQQHPPIQPPTFLPLPTHSSKPSPHIQKFQNKHLHPHQHLPPSPLHPLKFLIQQPPLKSIGHE